jgi:hypothetical protein
MKTLSMLSVVVLISWRFDHCVVDRLEIATEVPPVNWHSVPGPYPLSPGGTNYAVQITNSSPVLFFRVSRSWGHDPLVLTNELPERTQQNSTNCYD